MIKIIVISMVCFLCLGNIVMLNPTLKLSKEAAKYEKEAKKIDEEINDLEASIVRGSNLESTKLEANNLGLVQGAESIFVDSVIYAMNK
jgi:hypothetical protein